MNKQYAPIVYLHQSNTVLLVQLYDWASGRLELSPSQEREIIIQFSNSWHDSGGVVGQIAQHLTALEVRGWGILATFIKDWIAVSLERFLAEG